MIGARTECKLVSNLLSGKYMQGILPHSNHLDPKPHKQLSKPLPLPSQGFSSEAPGLFSITAKSRLLTQVSETCAHTSHRHTQKDMDTHAEAATTPSNAPTMHRFLFLRIIGSCSFSYSSAWWRILAVRTQMYIIKLALALLILSTRLQNSTPRSRQHFCHSRKWSSKAPLAHASKCPQKAIAQTVRMERLGSGTYQASLT